MGLFSARGLLKCVSVYNKSSKTILNLIHLCSFLILYLCYNLLYSGAIIQSFHHAMWLIQHNLANSTMRNCLAEVETCFCW